MGLITEIESFAKHPVHMNECFAARIQCFHDVTVPCKDAVYPPDAKVS